MKTFRRLVAVIVILLSIVGIVACLGVIGAVWARNDAITETVTTILTTVQTVASRNIPRLEQIEAGVTRSVETISQGRQNIEEAQTTFEESDPVIDLVSRLVGEDITPQVNRVLETFEGLSDTVSSLNTAAQLYNMLPGADFPRIAQATATIDAFVTDVRDTLVGLDQDVEALQAGASEALIQPVIDRLVQMEDRLTNVIADLQLYRQSLIELEAAVAQALPRVPSTVDAVSTAITILMAWLVLAQVSLLYLMVVWFRNGSLSFHPVSSPPPPPSAVAPVSGGSPSAGT